MVPRHIICLHNIFVLNTTVPTWKKDKHQYTDAKSLNNPGPEHFDERKVSSWIRRHTPKICKLLGIKYLGAEKEIMEFLQNLEKRKVSCRKFSSAKDPSSPRPKFASEVKNLVFSVKFVNRPQWGQGKFSPSSHK